MALLELTESNFDEETDRHSLMVLDFWASWCVPCRSFAPIFESVASEHPEILFGRINTEAELELAKSFEIRSIPTLIAVKDGTIVYARPGALTREKLLSLVHELKTK